ncbi:MAG TPA: DUF4190 domain-containing protein [Polyangiaceae bacterium]
MNENSIATDAIETAGYGPPGGGPPGGYGPPGGGGYGPPPGGGPPMGGGGYGPPGGGPPGFGPPPGGGGFGPPPGGGYGGPGGPPGMMMPGSMGPKFNPLAIVSMICGILSIPTCFCSCVAPGVNSPLALAAVVCGIIGLQKMKQQPQMWKGGGMAIAGIVTGGIGLILVLMAAFTELDDAIRHSSGL